MASRSGDVLAQHSFCQRFAWQCTRPIEVVTKTSFLSPCWFRRAPVRLVSVCHPTVSSNGMHAVRHLSLRAFSQAGIVTSTSDSLDRSHDEADGCPCDVFMTSNDNREFYIL